MWDLSLLAVITASFLLLNFMRSFSKDLMRLPGLALLPFLSAAIAIGVFAGYGFRPEWAPLLLFSVVYSLFHIPAVVRFFTGRFNVDYRPKKHGGAAVGLLVSALCLGFALWFSPYSEEEPLIEGVKTFTLKESGQRTRFVRVYGADTGPVLALFPPLTGSVGVVEPLCTALAERGFTVVTVSSRGLDYPALEGDGRKYYGSPLLFARLAMALAYGSVYSGPNEIAKKLEASRAEDIERLLRWIKESEEIPDSPVFLAGYGASGAALTMLSASGDFAAAHGEAAGIIAVEAPPASAFDTPTGGDAVPPDSPFYEKIWSRVKNFSLKPRRVMLKLDAGRALIPSLYLLSDGYFDSEINEKRYAAMEGFLTGGGTAVAAADGAGPADFSGIRIKYPVLGLFLGPGPDWGRYSLLEAQIFANFCDFALKLKEAPPSGLKVEGINAPLKFESRWNLFRSEYILHP
jgi:hypothetical protein